MKTEHIKNIIESVIADQTGKYLLFLDIYLTLFVFVTLFVSYLGKKGENYATKQDIHERLLDIHNSKDLIEG